MKTTLFLTVSIDGLIANQDGIPLFPDGAWEAWCSFVNDKNNVIAGRNSYEQLADDEMANLLNPTHKIVLSSQDLQLADSSWQHAKSPSEALEILRKVGVDEAIIGGGRAVAQSFMKDQLVDYIVIDLQPVAFGLGTPVFGDLVDIARLKLVDSKKLNDDAIRIRYQVLCART